MEKLVKVKKPTEEELIHNTFNALRTEQRQLATKLSEIELDLNEHRFVNLFYYKYILYITFIYILVINVINSFVLQHCY